MSWILDGFTFIGNLFISSSDADPPSPDRGTPPFPADLPSGSVTEASAQEGIRAVRTRKPSKRKLSSDTQKQQQTKQHRPLSDSRNVAVELAESSVSSNKSKGVTRKKKEKTEKKERDAMYERLRLLKHGDMEDNLEESDGRRPLDKAVCKYAAQLLSDEGIRSDASALKGSIKRTDPAHQPVSQETLLKTVKELKKTLIIAKKEAKTGEFIGNFGTGKEAVPIKNCVQSKNKCLKPKVTFIKENILSQTEKKGRPIQCKCTGPCNIDCYCLKISICAGKAFSYDNFCIKANGEDYWSTGIMACGPACSCKGTCFFGVEQFLRLLKIEIFRRDLNLGYGLRATKNIAAGEFVTEFRGIIQDEKVLNKDTKYAFKATAATEDQCQNSILVSSGSWNPKLRSLSIEPELSGNAGRFANASEHPNLYPIRVWVNDASAARVRMFFVSSRPIQAGEELYIDYGNAYYRDHLGKLADCKCLSPFCKSSEKLEGWSLEEKYELSRAMDNYVQSQLTKERADFGSLLKRWTTAKKELFSRALRAVLNRGVFYNTRRNRDEAINTFERLFLEKSEPLEPMNEFLCSKKQLEERKKYLTADADSETLTL